MNHQTSSVPQIAYQSPQVTTQPMTESPLVDSVFVVPVFSLGDDPIACLNKAMANISNYGSDIISEVPHSKTYLNDMENQSVHAMQDFEQIPAVDFTDNEIHSDSNIIFREKMIDSQMDDMIKEKLALKEQVDSYEQNLSKQIKEKECLLQTFNVFKSESKEKEDKYMENKIDLEKKIKKLNNIIFKVGQSAQIAHIKPYDASPVKIEAPKELTKVSLVNESLKKLKFHLARFDNVVKIRTTPDACKEYLLNEIMEVQTIFDQMDTAVQQFSVDKQCLEIAKKELFLENDRLLQQIMSQDVLLTVMNSMSLLSESMNVDGKRKESCNLEAKLLKSQNAFNNLLKR
ncbi:hypothetical protein Tco_0813760 [Tanacetum coccineum]